MRIEFFRDFLKINVTTLCKMIFLISFHTWMFQSAQVPTNSAKNNPFVRSILNRLKKNLMRKDLIK
jgi:hypothetical protein